MTSVARTACDARKAIEVVRDFYEALAADYRFPKVPGETEFIPLPEE